MCFEDKEMTFISWSKDDKVKTYENAEKWIVENVPDCDYDKERYEITVKIRKIEN